MLDLKELFTDPDTRGLAKAAADGDRTLLKNLVNEADDPNAPGLRGMNLLMWSLHERDLKATRALLEVGADPNQLDDLGDSAMGLAATADDEKPLVLLLEFDGDANLRTSTDDPLTHLTIERLNWPGLHALVAAGADLNATNRFGNTPMLLAAMIGQFEGVSWLLDQGADATLENNTGGTLLRLIDRSPIAADSEQDKWRLRVRDRITPDDDAS